MLRKFQKYVYLPENTDVSMDIIHAAEQECNVHIGRYGVKNTQESNNSWSRHMNDFLVGMNHARKRGSFC